MNKNELKNIVSDELDRFNLLHEIYPYSKKIVMEYYVKEYEESLREMSKINVKDFDYFPWYRCVQ